MQQLIDCHNHSTHSFDGSASVRAMCERAEALSLTAFAITDHCDMNMLTEEEALKTAAASTAEMRQVRSEMAGCGCKLLRGIELGEPAENFPLAEAVLACTEYDVVIGSVHNAPGLLDFYYVDFSGPIDPIELLHSYFALVIKTVEWGKFDTLAHLTYPLRYYSERGVDVDLTQFYGEIDTIFRMLIERGLSLECNTSGLRQQIGKTMPDETLLARYRALGGKLITLGSDAHKTEDVGKGIAEGMAQLKALGFETVNYYENRKPVFVPLV